MYQKALHRPLFILPYRLHATVPTLQRLWAAMAWGVLIKFLHSLMEMETPGGCTPLPAQWSFPPLHTFLSSSSRPQPSHFLYPLTTSGQQGQLCEFHSSGPPRAENSICSHLLWFSFRISFFFSMAISTLDLLRQLPPCVSSILNRVCMEGTQGPYNLLCKVLNIMDEIQI